jgi:hypothetical protein
MAKPGDVAERLLSFKLSLTRELTVLETSGIERSRRDASDFWIDFRALKRPANMSGRSATVP